MIADPEVHAAIQARAQAAARQLRLPLRNHAWRGMSGSWVGMGTGSSIDFQDHRPYFPGDDPRYIDWQAYARSGNYTMKLYREEVSPSVDIALDISPSMAVDSPKATRSMELFHFAVASAVQSRGSLRCYFISGQSITSLPVEAALSFQKIAELCQPSPASDPTLPALERIPWRTGSLRVWISDLLYPGQPALKPLAASKGRGVLLAPWCPEEAEPDWEGNLEFIDCETGVRRNQRVHSSLLASYRESYRRHFQIWREHSRQLGISFARVPAGTAFLEALHSEALPNGALEIV